MKIYLSQGVENRNTLSIRAEREEALELLLKAYGKRVKLAPESVLYMDEVDCYSVALNLMQIQTAELVVFLPEWEEYESCRIERMAAELYGFPIPELARDDAGLLKLPNGMETL